MHAQPPPPSPGLTPKPSPPNLNPRKPPANRPPQTGESYGLLKDGHAVKNESGVSIPPEMVVAPLKPGRVLSIAAACSDPSRIACIAQGADILVADACCGEWGGDEEGAGVGLEEGVVGVAKVAEAAGVKRLVLTGFKAG